MGNLDDKDKVQLAKIAAGLGLIAVVAGLIVGLAPQSGTLYYPTRTITCGSAWAPEPRSYTSVCTQELPSGGLAVALCVIGGLLIIGAWSWWLARGPRDTA
jgi:hypothetical protein